MRTTNPLQLNLGRLAALCLPVCLRKPLITALATALLAPMHTLHAQFHSRRKARLDSLVITPQSRMLCHALNRELDPIDKTFTITDCLPRGEWVMAYSEAHLDLGPTLIPPAGGGAVVLWNRLEIISTSRRFTVNVPPHVWSDPQQLARARAITDTYRLPSTQPTYQPITE